MDFSEPTTAKGTRSCKQVSKSIYRVFVLKEISHLDLSVETTLLLIKLIVVVGVHLEVVEGELLLDTLLELLALLEGEGVGLGNNGNDVDDIGELLQDDDINGLQGVA